MTEQQKEPSDAEVINDAYGIDIANDPDGLDKLLDVLNEESEEES